MRKKLEKVTKKATWSASDLAAGFGIEQVTIDGETLPSVLAFDKDALGGVLVAGAEKLFNETGLNNSHVLPFRLEHTGYGFVGGMEVVEAITDTEETNVLPASSFLLFADRVIEIALEMSNQHGHESSHLVMDYYIQSLEDSQSEQLANVPTISQEF